MLKSCRKTPNMLQPTLLDIKRIHALTDGTFAVATTILILNVEVPEGLTIANMHEMLLEKVAPSLFIYMLGFIILGSFWNESHYHHHVVLKSDIVSSWLHILFLMFVCIIPFSSHFVAFYHKEKISIIFYLVNILCVNFVNMLNILYMFNMKYVTPNMSKDDCYNIIYRIMIPSLFYLLYIPLAFYIYDWILFIFPLPFILQIILSGIRRRISVPIQEPRTIEKM